MNDFYKSVTDSLGDELTKGIAIALCIIMLFSSGFFFGTLTSPAVKEDAPAVNATESTAPTQATTAPTTQPTTAPTTQAPAGDNGGETATTAPQASNGEKTTAEIVQLYNDSANKVKTNATKVVKNYEYRRMNEETLVMPGALKSLASTIIPKFMSDDLEPQIYDTPELIKEKFIVPGADYVSKLTEADVVEATCTDNGTEYEIMIKVKDETNPVQGAGVGAAFDVIEMGDMTNNEYGKMIERFDCKYFNCVLKCKIDKASGNMTWANYTTPEDIRYEFIVPDQDYVSKLTEADVVEATCTDNGTEYEIMIKVIDQKNPTAGSGVGAGFDVLETADIMNSPASSMLESFDVTYTNCVLKCKINKDTKNMIWASYYTPVRFEIVAKFLGKTYDVSMDLSFDKDYTITY